MKKAKKRRTACMYRDYFPLFSLFPLLSRFRVTVQKLRIILCRVLRPRGLVFQRLKRIKRRLFILDLANYNVVYVCIAERKLKELSVLKTIMQ